jgi:hypothetical protein
VVDDHADLASVAGETRLPFCVGQAAGQRGQRTGPLFETIGQRLCARARWCRCVTVCCDTTLVIMFPFKFGRVRATAGSAFLLEDRKRPSKDDSRPFSRFRCRTGAGVAFPRPFAISLQEGTPLSASLEEGLPFGV